MGNGAVLTILILLLGEFISFLNLYIFYRGVPPRKMKRATFWSSPLLWPADLIKIYGYGATPALAIGLTAWGAIIVLEFFLLEPLYWPWRILILTVLNGVWFGCALLFNELFGQLKQKRIAEARRRASRAAQGADRGAL